MGDELDVATDWNRVTAHIRMSLELALARHPQVGAALLWGALNANTRSIVGNLEFGRPCEHEWRGGKN